MGKDFEVVGNYFSDVKAYCNHNSAKSCFEDMVKADKKGKRGKLAAKFVEHAIQSSHIGNEKVSDLVKVCLEKLEKNKKSKFSDKYVKKAKDLKKQFKAKSKNAEPNGKDEKKPVDNSSSSSSQASSKPKTLISRMKALPQDLVDKIGLYLVPDMIREVQGNLDDKRLSTLKPWILKIANQVTTLDLSNCRMTNNRLQEIVKQYPKLETLVLDHVGFSPNDETLKIVSQLQQLKKLQILRKGEHEFTESGFKHLRKLKNLNELLLGNCDKVGDGGILHLVKLKHLRSLNFESQLLTNAGFKTITSLSSLRNLKLSLTHSEVNNEGLNELQNLHHLESLELFPRELNDTLLQHCSTLVNLHTLLLDCYVPLSRNFTDQGVQHLTQLPNLRVLGLHSREMTNASLQVIGGFTQLRELRIEGDADKINGEGLKALENLVHLEALRLSCHVKDEDLKHFSKFVNLRTLYLASAEISGSGFVHFLPLVNLRHLDLSQSDYIKNKSLQFLAKLPELQTLKLSFENMDFSDKGVEALGAHPKLETLEVDGCKLSKKGFEAISKFPKLRRLKLVEFLDDEDLEGSISPLEKMKGLQELSLSEGISHKVIKSIAKISSLVRLTLDECDELKDSDLEQLSKLNNLTYLRIDSCRKVTDAGVKHLLKLKNLRRFRIEDAQKVSAQALDAFRDQGIFVLT